MKLDTSYKVPDYGNGMSTDPVEPKKQKVVYPEISFTGEAAKELMRCCQQGETFEANVIFKVTGVTSRSGGSREWGPNDEQRVEMEIQGIELPDMKERTRESDDSEEAINEYLKSKK